MYNTSSNDDSINTKIIPTIGTVTPTIGTDFLLSLHDRVCDIYDKTEQQRMEIVSIQSELKKLGRDIKKHLKEQAGIIVAMEKAKKPRDPSKYKSGFAAPLAVSTELLTFLSLPMDTKISRSDVTVLVHKYIDDHGLKNMENKQYILPDDALQKLFGEQQVRDEIKANDGKGVRFFSIQKYMNRHYIK